MVDCLLLLHLRCPVCTFFYWHPDQRLEPRRLVSFLDCGNPGGDELTRWEQLVLDMDILDCWCCFYYYFSWRWYQLLNDVPKHYLLQSTQCCGRICLGRMVRRCPPYFIL